MADHPHSHYHHQRKDILVACHTCAAAVYESVTCASRWQDEVQMGDDHYREAPEIHQQARSRSPCSPDHDIQGRGLRVREAVLMLIASAMPHRVSKSLHLA